jgi:hypothetical protein
LNAQSDGLERARAAVSQAAGPARDAP